MGRRESWLTTLVLLTSLAAFGPLGEPVGMVIAQVTEPGICPFSIPLTDWNEEKFVSRPWYELKALSVPGLHDALRPGCTRWHFTPSDDGLGLHARLQYRATDGDAAVRAFAQYTTSEKHPRFNLTFDDLAGATRSVHMRLVATDYDDFALLWGCTEPNIFERKVVSWVLSRRPVLSDNAQEALSGLFSSHDIRTEKLVETNHDDQTCGAAEPSVQWSDPLEGLEEFEDGLVMNHGLLAGSAFSRDIQQHADDSLDVGIGTGKMLSKQQRSNISGRDGDDDSVSSSYLGGESSGWSGWLVKTVDTQTVLVAVLLALILVSLITTIFAVRALAHRRCKGSAIRSVLPVHRQDVVVATLHSDYDYRRFGSAGNPGDFLQTRKATAGL